MAKVVIEFDFDSAVFDYFMEHGTAATAKELAEYAGVPISRVRKVVSSNRYKSSCTTVDRPVIERNYMTIRCYRPVDAYRPSYQMLREEVIELRNKLRGV